MYSLYFEQMDPDCEPEWQHDFEVLADAWDYVMKDKLCADRPWVVLPAQKNHTVLPFGVEEAKFVPPPSLGPGDFACVLVSKLDGYCYYVEAN